jgi:hypothetical protein
LLVIIPLSNKAALVGNFSSQATTATQIC